MSSRLNLEAMTREGLKFVTRLSAATLQSVLGGFSLEKQWELGDRQRMLDLTFQGKRYVMAGGQWRQQRDQERRTARLAKAEAQLKRLADVRRKKVNAQKLSSQVGRTLQRLKAHKYFNYEVTPEGQLQWCGVQQ